MTVLANQTVLIGQEDAISNAVVTTSSDERKMFLLKNGVLSQDEAHHDYTFNNQSCIDAPMYNEAILGINTSAFKKGTKKSMKTNHLRP